MQACRPENRYLVNLGMKAAMKARAEKKRKEKRELLKQEKAESAGNLPTRSRKKPKKREPLGTIVCDNCGETVDSYAVGKRFCGSKCNREFHKPERDKKVRRNRFIIFNRDQHRCIYCGRSSIEDGAKLHIDHIIPRSKGGKDVASNLVTACQPCNTYKNDRISDSTQRVQIEVLKRNKLYSIKDCRVIKIKV